MSIIDFKMPKIKFNKMKMDVMNELEEIDYEKLQKKNTKQKRNTPYEDKTNYKTIKEAFLESVKKYPKEECILEKPSHKEAYKIITYSEFKNDIWALGTSLIKMLNLKDKRVVIVGETQYGWYVSYMAMLCGVGIAVPTDRELPVNELENIIKRSKATAVIYSSKKANDIREIKEKVPEVEYFIEMKSDKKLDGKDVGLEFLIDTGKKLISSGDESFNQIEIDPEEFKILFFTSGTTSQAKGVMLNNRNLAENINAVTAYVKLYPSCSRISISYPAASCLFCQARLRLWLPLRRSRGSSLYSTGRRRLSLLHRMGNSLCCRLPSENPAKRRICQRARLCQDIPYRACSTHGAGRGR